MFSKVNFLMHEFTKNVWLFMFFKPKKRNFFITGVLITYCIKTRHGHYFLLYFRDEFLMNFKNIYRTRYLKLLASSN